jgi:hypothetical protein
MFFTFPEDARWNADRQAVEFGVEIGEYHGVVWVLWRVFQHFWRSGRPRAVCRRVLPPADTLRASLSVNSAGAYLPRTATSKSRGATCARAPGALLSVAAWQRGNDNRRLAAARGWTFAPRFGRSAGRYLLRMRP